MAGLTSKKIDDALGDGVGNCIINSMVNITVSTVTVNIFFDGTGNNKENTALRLKIDDYLTEMGQLNLEIEEKEVLERELYMRSQSLPKEENFQLDEEIQSLRVGINSLYSKRNALKEDKKISENLEKETSYNNDIYQCCIIRDGDKKNASATNLYRGSRHNKV